MIVVKYTRMGLVVKRPGVLSKVQMLNLVLGVGVFSLLPNFDVLHISSFHREGANREKLTVKKIINNEMFFSPL